MHDGRASFAHDAERCIAAGIQKYLSARLRLVPARDFLKLHSRRNIPYRHGPSLHQPLPASARHGFEAGATREKDFAAFRRMPLTFLYPFEYNSACIVASRKSACFHTSVKSISAVDGEPDESTVRALALPPVAFSFLPD